MIFLAPPSQFVEIENLAAGETGVKSANANVRNGVYMSSAEKKKSTINQNFRLSNYSIDSKSFAMYIKSSIKLEAS